MKMLRLRWLLFPFQIRFTKSIWRVFNNFCRHLEPYIQRHRAVDRTSRWQLFDRFEVCVRRRQQVVHRDSNSRSAMDDRTYLNFHKDVNRILQRSETFFTVRLVKSWNELPGDNVNFSSLARFECSIVSTFLIIFIVVLVPKLIHNALWNHMYVLCMCAYLYF